ncbi:MAG: cation:proton antiporter [Turneriella sp.]|nr:cation:proton antiporter [Turneriella sp.]
MIEILQDYLSSMAHAIRGTEITYALLIISLFVIPRILIRLGIPMALSAFAMGSMASTYLGFADGDQVISQFASLGIIGLFLFAGMEVDLRALRQNLRHIIEHLAVRMLVIAVLTVIICSQFSLTVAAGVLIALAIATPSTGFILDNLANSELSDDRKYWIKLKAISAEIVALGLLLIVTQGQSVGALAGSITVIFLLLLLLPFLFKKLAVIIERIAPGSEFTFLLMLGVIFGIVTKKLGAYYLVGAFMVGIMAGRYRRETRDVPTEQMLKSLHMFAAFFMPFYFFNAGMQFPTSALNRGAWIVAGVFFLLLFPIKLISIMMHRKVALHEGWRDSLPVALSLMPNLVFGLVLAELIKVIPAVPPEVYGGLVLFTLLITALAPMILKALPVASETTVYSTDDQLMQPGFDVFSKIKESRPGGDELK